MATWIDWYIAGAAGNLPGIDDDLQAMKVLAVSGAQYGSGHQKALMAALLPWLFTEDEARKAAGVLGEGKDVAQRIWRPPLAYQVSQDLLGRLVGKAAPETTDHLAVMREHNLYLDLPGRGMPITDEQSIRAVFVQPTRRENSWMVVAMLTNGRNNAMTGRYGWVTDGISGLVSPGTSVGSSIEDALPPESVATSVMEMVKLVLLYAMSHQEESPEYLPRTTPSELLKLKPKKKKAKQKTHTLFSVRRLYPRKRDSLPPSREGKWTLNHVVEVEGHFKWQAYGKGLKKRKLIYIDPYERGRGQKKHKITRL